MLHKDKTNAWFVRDGRRSDTGGVVVVVFISAITQEAAREIERASEGANARQRHLKAQESRH